MTVLGIVAGGGELPIAIAESASDGGKPVFVVALQGIADPDVGRFAHAWVSLGEIGRMSALLREHGCGEVLLVGKVSRPKWSDLSFDAKAMLKLPKVMAAALKGDDALLRAFVEIIEEDGFRAVSAAEAAPGLLATAGVLGQHRPSQQDRADIAQAVQIVRALGALDVGQAVIVCEGLALAVEAAEGTDAMIARVAELPEHLRGSEARRKGVLVKARKPTQDGRTDLPVIGTQTVAKAARVGLAGIAVETGAALIVNKRAVAEAADKSGLFLFGFEPQQFA
jgi:DUF1009 family protein